MADTDKGAPGPAPDLTRSLRHASTVYAGLAHHATAALLREAADTLDAVAREARRLRLDRDGLVGQRTLLHADCVALREDRAAAALEIGALRARVEELESAIRAHIATPPWARCPSTHCERRQECASPHECSGSGIPALRAILPSLPEAGEVGNADTDVVIDSLGGICPVEGEGTINGQPFYFRARGGRWSLAVGGTDPVVDPAWTYSEPYGDWADAAGFMTEDEALRFIVAAAVRYAAALAQEERDHAE